MSPTQPPRSHRRPTRPGQPKGPNWKLIGGVVGAVVFVTLLAIFAVAASNDSDDANAAPEFGAVEVSSSALPVLPEAGADPAIGLVGPTIRSERPEGSITIEPATEGEPMMLVFLAHWCPFCQAELPRLVELASEGGFDGVRTVAIATGTDPLRPNGPPSAWLDREGWTGEAFYDDADGAAAAAYGLSGFPFIVFLDADGKVALRVSGEQPAGAIEAAIAAIAPRST